jgi:transcriptional regulator with XRE-family HTH domain
MARLWCCQRCWRYANIWPMTANPGGSPEQKRGRIPADTFANRLLLARRMNGLTIKQAAELIQVEGERDVASSWSNWENGRRPRDAPDTIRIIATALDVDEQWLMFGGPLSPSVRPARITRRPGEATARYLSMSDRPRDNRPRGRSGPIDNAPANRRRSVRISRPIAE